jgi:hypothetical protein
MYSQLTVRNYSAGKATTDFFNMIEGKSRSAGTGLFNVFDEIG